MRHVFLTLTLVVGSLWLAPAAIAQNRAGDIGNGPMEGTWTVTGWERDGNPWREIAGATMTITATEFTLQTPNNGPVYKGEIKPANRQQEFDFVQKEGPDAGKTWAALVSSNGQLLKICYSVAGDGPRPTSLTTSPGEGTSLIGLRRK
jgi:uncharacterized protein (TIGR03067 family)